MMSRFLFFVLFLGGNISIIGQEDTIELPRYLTQEEILLKDQFPTSAIPKTHINNIDLLLSDKRSMGEWEELQGITIAWSNSFKNIQREIVRHSREECNVIILCKNCGSAEDYLMDGGIDISSNVEFVSTDYNSLWIRDYGPNSVYVNDVDSLIIVDWIYNRPRPKDDVTPYTIADHLGVPIIGTTDFPTDLVHTGGNFMADGMGIGFSSNLVLNENGPNNTWGISNHTSQDVDNLMYDFMGIEEYIKMTVLPYDAIHHIDMHMKLIDEETLLIGIYPENIADGPIIEANIEYIKENFKTSFGRDFEIIRITMPPDFFGSYPDNNGDYRTYTNAVFVNKTVLLPVYEEKYDTTAIRVWEEMLPGHKIVGIDCNSIIPLSGAIHCITKEIGANDPILINHARIRSEELETDISHEIKAQIQHKSGIEEAKVFYTFDDWQNFSVLNMSVSDLEMNEWSAQIPSNSPGEITKYYISAKANSGKSIYRPITGKEGAWSFTEPVAVSAKDLNSGSLSMSVFPNPSSALVCIKLDADPGVKTTLELYDVLGRKVKSFINEDRISGEKAFFIHAADFTPGTYFVHLISEDMRRIEKLSLF